MDENFSYNRSAVKLIQNEVLPNLEALRIGAKVLSNGATVIDMGVEYPGSWAAARYFVLIGLGGCADVTYGKMWLRNTLVPTINVYVTDPVVSEMSSHVAYWKLNFGGKLVVISGPIRAIQAPDIFSQAVTYRDKDPGCAVAMIQTDEIPDEALTGLIAEHANIPTRDLYVIVAKTACIVGAVQVAARNVEQTLPALKDQGFNINSVVQAYGVSPIVAIVADEQEAYGRVNDCLIYGQETTVWVDCSDEEIQEVLPVLAFAKNQDVYGIPFRELFERCGSNWANVPRPWDAPCKVNFINTRTGRNFSTGRLNPDVLLQGFKGGIT